MKSKKKVILITGASSGMGKEAAKLLVKQGYIVYAASRHINSMRDLKKIGIIPLKMDVSKKQDIEAGVKRIIKDQKRIDVLINNAGFGLYGPIEEIPIEDARYQFEVNLFGLAQLTQLVLPYMRKQKSGRIINISSMGGKIYTPLGAWYHATKHALEGWSDCLRMEVEPFNIHVSLIEPGIIKTNFMHVMLKQLERYTRKGSPYARQVKSVINAMDGEKAAKVGTDAQILAKTFVLAATERYPKRRYVKGSMAKSLIFIRKWFGDGVYEFLIKRSFK